jgi:hypothetical protein
MVPYADRVEPADRWAIVAYIRALQLSQHAPVAGLPAEVRTRLASSDAGRAEVEPEPGAVAQPNRQQAAPPETRALPLPPSNAGAQAQPASGPTLQSMPGRTAPALAAPLGQRVGTPPRNEPGPQTGVPSSEQPTTQPATEPATQPSRAAGRQGGS